MREEEENLIDLTSILGKLLKTVRKFWMLIVIGTAAAAAGCYLYAQLRYQPVYQSQATFSVNTEGSPLGSGSSAAEQVRESLLYILDSEVMKNMVMDDLQLSSFPAWIELESKELANFYVLKVNAADAQTSGQILESMLRNCPKASVYVLGKIEMDILDQSGIPTAPVNARDKRRSLLLGAAAGLLVCLGAAFVYSLTNRTIEKEEDFKKYLSVSCIASVPQVSFKKRRKQFDRHIHIYNDKISYGFLEAIRTVRTRVEREAERTGEQVILVTSSIPGEGKSTIASNLALSLAEKGRRVVLVDMDLRNPSIGKTLGMEAKGKAGVAGVLKKKQKLEDALQVVREWKLTVLFGGEAQADPAKLLGTGDLPGVIARLKEQYDYVILDTPPAAMLADASVIAGCADGAVYVVKQGYARIERIAEGLEALTIAGVPIIGSILNGLEVTLGGYGSYRYSRYGSYGGYGAYGEPQRRRKEKSVKEKQEKKA